MGIYNLYRDLLYVFNLLTQGHFVDRHSVDNWIVDNLFADRDKKIDNLSRVMISSAFYVFGVFFTVNFSARCGCNGVLTAFGMHLDCIWS